jgi:cytochrome c5
MLRPAVTGLAVAFLGCRAPPAQTMGMSDDSAGLLLAAARVALPPPTVAPADLPDRDAAGAQLLVAYCTGCHALPSPAIHSATDWPSVLRRMWLRMERLDPAFRVPVPTAAERVVLSAYMLEHALRVTEAALPDGRGKSQFVTRCSRCHELPDPRQHSSEDWVTVVSRMREHMEVMLRETPPQSELRDIMLYLGEVTRARG